MDNFLMGIGLGTMVTVIWVKGLGTTPAQNDHLVNALWIGYASLCVGMYLPKRRP